MIKDLSLRVLPVFEKSTCLELRSRERKEKIFERSTRILTNSKRKRESVGAVFRQKMVSFGVVLHGGEGKK